MSKDDKAKQRHLENLERLKNFRLLDDDFMTKCFDNDTECVEFVLQILLNKPDLQVTEAQTQVFVANLLKRSVRLDVLATDSASIKYNIEIQRSDKGAGQKRARYNSSMLDARLLQKGDDFDDLPETYVIFITENDVIGEGLPLYPVERYISVTGERFDDGAHIIYVNGAYRDDSLVGKLMHDFSCANPDEMYYDVLANKVRFLKESKEGVAVMCRAMEDMWNQALKEGWQEGMEKGVQEGMEKGIEKGIEKGRQENKRMVALAMLADKQLSLEKIAEYTGLSMEEVQHLKDGKTA